MAVSKLQTETTLKPKFRAQSIPHVCGQTTLDELGGPA